MASPPGPLSEAWLAESKDGLVQMLREHRPFEQQSLAVFSMLAANAPPLPAADTSWWRGEYTLRSSHALAEWLEDESDQQLLEGSVVSIKIDERVEVRLQLACGLSLLFEGAIEVRAVGAAAMITLTFDDANFYRVRAENNEAMVSPASRTTNAARMWLPKRRRNANANTRIRARNAM